MQRPGFERLVALVCSGDVGSVYCIEASRLARNGRDWRHLIELCALAGSLVVDPDGAYDPRLVNDRLLLENAHTKKNCERKSARGGRALLTGLVRCGRCGRMIRVFYAMTRRWLHADTNWSIPPNATLPASWKRAGTLRWSVWPNSNAGSMS